MNDREKLYLEAKKAYYQGKPIMTDERFDQLEAELKEYGSSVIEIVGIPSGMTNERVKFPHLTPMLSLAKIHADKDNNPPIEEFTKWWKKVGSPMSIEKSPKYDGNSVNIIYEKGKLKTALTRGDGAEGSDITEKVKTLVPNEIDLLGTVEIRGEMLMPVRTFKSNARYHKFANARNLVAGILGAQQSTDWEMVADLEFIPYEVRIINKTNFEFLDEPVEFFKRSNFKWLPDIELCQIDADGMNGRYVSRELKVIFQKAVDVRDDYKYQLDGVVFKVCESTERKKLGNNTSEHHPLWAMAVKFAPKLTTTTINDITWTMGKTGNFTPVAILEPVELDGSIVSKASMYNYGWVKEHEAYPGAIVSLCKRGDIIPAIDSIIEKSKEFY